MEIQTDGILRRILKAFSNEKILLKNPREFRNFWKAVCKPGFRITKPILGNERVADPIKFADDCLDWLEGSPYRHLCFELKATENTFATIQVCFVLWVEEDNETDLTGLQRRIANIKVNKEH